MDSGSRRAAGLAWAQAVIAGCLGLNYVTSLMEASPKASEAGVLLSRIVANLRATDAESCGVCYCSFTIAASRVAVQSGEFENVGFLSVHPLFTGSWTGQSLKFALRPAPPAPCESDRPSVAVLASLHPALDMFYGLE